MTTKITYFGYGSLVNRRTRDASERAARATLNGWERQWAHQARRRWELPESAEDTGVITGAGVCALTVAENPVRSIDGVLVEISRSELPTLDKRERGYHRITLPTSCFSSESEFSTDTVSMYVSDQDHWGWASEDFPIINSYVDCVIAGFRTQFGEDGASRFIETTEGWGNPALNERHAPLYPRAVSLSARELQWIDDLLIKSFKTQEED